MASQQTASSPSNPSTPTSAISDILTPRSKVQRLLAQVSDSESDVQSPLPPTSYLVSNVKIPSNTKSDHSAASEDDGDEDSQHRVPVGGKLAARLLIHEPESTLTMEDDASVIKSTGLANHHAASASSSERRLDIETSDDELVTAFLSRRAVTDREMIAPRSHDTFPNARQQPDSPPFSPSTTMSPQNAVQNQKSLGQLNNRQSPSNSRSKFLALVDKHRRERLAKEATEAANVERNKAGSEQKSTASSRRRLQRGSSPADASEDDESSDEKAAERISKQARPTRKASKKALEEMNRETQRMSRSMQLAHQARTRTKITKDSLLARFNFVSPAITSNTSFEKSSEVGSAAASDCESPNLLSTPPTSPIPVPDSKDVGPMIDSLAEPVEMHGALDTDDELADLDITLGSMLRSTARERIQEYVQKNRTVISPKPQHISVTSTSTTAFAFAAAAVIQSEPSRTLKKRLLTTNFSDSESEIEVIKDRSSRRKYAAFKTLPKRKAKEMPSHLALRSLAHVTGNEDKKRTMNAAEMEVSLRKKARLQAIDERNRKIEELRAKGVVIQTAEERERDQQEVEDLVERARQEAVEIQKREKELAKKEGTYTRDSLDDEEDDSDDETLDDDMDADEVEDDSASDEESVGDGDDDDNDGAAINHDGLTDDQAATASSSDNEEAATEIEEDDSDNGSVRRIRSRPQRPARKQRIVSDDEDDESFEAENKENFLPTPPGPAKTPQSVTRSARKVIPGLQMSDDLPMGLSQAFAATMAESQDLGMDTGSQPEYHFDTAASLPSPNTHLVNPLERQESIDMVCDSQPASQTPALNVETGFPQNRLVPESPAHGLGISALDFTPSQRNFELTQDVGYLLSPFSGSRFAETPSRHPPQSTIDTLIMPSHVEQSPILQRHGRLKRGRRTSDEGDSTGPVSESAFEIMKRSTKRKEDRSIFDKSKSEAKQHFDEAAEESEDEYAGLGGASDEEGDLEENEDDRNMIDEDTQVGVGDEAKLAGFYADRERERDEKDVSKLLKDITTGALRRKRGAGDDLDLSDEEDAAARRREVKRREFARMRRELLKDEAIGKIAEDKRKEAFLKSIEDREEDLNDEGFDEPETQDQESQSQAQIADSQVRTIDSREKPLHQTNQNPALNRMSDSMINSLQPTNRRTQPNLHRKPINLVEIRESVSFLIEEPDSQAAVLDLGLSDSEDEPEAYVDLDRHLKGDDGDENGSEDNPEDLDDFIVEDENPSTQDFKKPELPTKERAPFSERRTKHENVVDRLSLLRKASSSSSGSNSNGFNKMAFFSSKAGSGTFNGVPSLLRRATTNSSLGSMSGRDNVSATGVSVNGGVGRTERGDAASEKEFIRKGSNGRRNAVNYQARPTLKEEKMSQRAGIAKAKSKASKKRNGGFLNGLFGSTNWT